MNTDLVQTTKHLIGDELYFCKKPGQLRKQHKNISHGCRTKAGGESEKRLGQGQTLRCRIFTTKASMAPAVTVKPQIRVKPVH